MTAAMKAAQAVTASCVAGELHWEPDLAPGLVDDPTHWENDVGRENVSRHMSRPCLLERCTPAPADVEALRTSARAAKALVDGDPSLHIPTFEGFVALSGAMVAFADTALAAGAAAPDKDKALRASGLSMHYAAVAAAFHELYADVDVPREPPSLVASLAAPAPGGDPCKGWRFPQDCDVREVRVPAVRTWRTDPACIEVESIKK
jgi:hypothetical protein